MWVKDFVGKDGVEVWVDDSNDRFIILQPVSDRWVIRVGVRSNSSMNQEMFFKNRSRAMTSVRNLLNTKSWRVF